MTAGRALSLAVALALVPGVTAEAAPPASDQAEDLAEDLAEDCECEGMVAREDCTRMTAIEINGRGLEKFEAGDFQGAIELWEQAIVLLPESKRDTIRVPLAHAYRGTYAIDNDIEHLRKALALFREQLEITDPDDQETRAQLEGEIAAIEAELDAIAAEKERLEAARIQQEQEVARDQAFAEANASHEHRMRKIRLSLEVSGLVVGAGLIAAGSVFLAYDGTCWDSDIEVLETCPRVYEATAPGIASLAIGGGLLITSIVLLTINERRRARKTREVAFEAPGVLRF